MTDTNTDNWAHRGEHMCGTCMWFMEKMTKVSPGEADSLVVKTFGRCRRHAPTMSGFPAVFGTDWCGDHKLDENKMSRARNV